MATTDLILTDREENRILDPSKEWSDSYAKKVAVRDFENSEADRSSNHDPRWADSEKLYLAYESGKTWDGTRQPRANIPVFMVFKQVESLLPRFMDIFADYPWAEAEALPGTSPEVARNHRDLILAQFAEAGGQRHCRRAFKSGLIYGNGIVEVGWRSFKRKRTRHIPVWRESIAQFLPTPQGIVSIPGPKMRFVQTVEDEEIINQPYMSYVSLKDFYIDPNCESPFVQDARFAIKRTLLTLDYLKMLRSQEADEGFNVPGDEELLKLLMTKHTSHGDQRKSDFASMRGESFMPGDDTSVDPGSKKLEVLEYKTADHHVWILEREHTIYNKPNQYGAINFFDCFYTDVLDRFYGLSIADVVEGDQRVSRSLIECRLDELALGVHRTRLIRRGAAIPAYQQRRRPGGSMEVNDIEADVKFVDVADVTQNAVFEQQAAELRSQGTTGVTELSVTGMPATQGNSAARTATGVSAQTGAVGKRHGYLVETNECEFLEPLLDFMGSMNNTFLDPDTKIQFLGGNGEQQEIEDPTQIMNSRVKFKLKAGSRIRAKAGAKEIVQMLLPVALNPGFMAQLAKEGKAVDFTELTALIADAADRQSKSLFRDLNEQEMQAMNQPPPEEVLRMQMQRERLQSAGDNAEMKGIFDLLKQMAANKGAKEVAEMKPDEPRKSE